MRMTTTRTPSIDRSEEDNPNKSTRIHLLCHCYFVVRMKQKIQLRCVSRFALEHECASRRDCIIIFTCHSVFVVVVVTAFVLRNLRLRKESSR